MNNLFKIFSMILVLMISSCSYYKGQIMEKESLRWNHLENEWTYAEDHEQLRWNYLEERWEFSK